MHVHIVLLRLAENNAIIRLPKLNLYNLMFISVHAFLQIFEEAILIYFMIKLEGLKISLILFTLWNGFC